jgi:hypothetical protein
VLVAVSASCSTLLINDWKRDRLVAIGPVSVHSPKLGACSQRRFGLKRAALHSTHVTYRLNKTHQAPNEDDRVGGFRCTCAAKRTNHHRREAKLFAVGGPDDSAAASFTGSAFVVARSPAQLAMTTAFQHVSRSREYIHRGGRRIRRLVVRSRYRVAPNMSLRSRNAPACVMPQRPPVRFA